MTVSVALTRAERVEACAHEPANQEMILRLGLNTNGIEGVARVKFVKDLAYTVANAKGSRA